MPELEAVDGLTCATVLGVAARLLRNLIQWGELSDELAGRLARDLSPDQWRDLDVSERQHSIETSHVVMGAIRDRTRLPIGRKRTGWFWEDPGKAIRCQRCGRLLGFSTEDHTLRVVIPTISLIEIQSGVVRCTCGQERMWRPYNPN
jgi:hypothetical protein